MTRQRQTAVANSNRLAAQQSEASPSRQDPEQAPGVVLREGDLRVTVKKACHLPKMDRFGSCDPMVELWLGPEAGARKQHTSHVSNVYEADFSTQGPFTWRVSDFTRDLSGGLTARICDWNRTQANQHVGDLSVPGAEMVALAASWAGDAVSRTVRGQVSLAGKPVVGQDKAPTELELALEWRGERARQPLDEAAAPPPYVKVTVVKAENLPKADFTGKCDPYVKCRLEGTSMQTRVVANTYDADFDEEFVFEWAGRQTLSIELWDHDRSSRDDLLGAASLDLHDALRRDSIWLNILDSKDRSVVGKSKQPTRVQLRVVPAKPPGSSGDGEAGRAEGSGHGALSAAEKKEVARLFKGLTGHEWSLCVGLCWVVLGCVLCVVCCVLCVVCVVCACMCMCVCVFVCKYSCVMCVYVCV